LGPWKKQHNEDKNAESFEQARENFKALSIIKTFKRAESIEIHLVF
jgi:hypothetical protein